MEKKVTYETTESVKPSPLVLMTTRELISAILCGVGVGLLTAAVMYMMNKFVFGAVLCRPEAPADCAQAPAYSMIVAMVIGGIAGVVSLARLRIFRPLIAVLATTIALWGLHTILMNVAWYWGLLVAMLLFGLTYGLFAWVSRLRSFILALVIAIVLVVIIRWALFA